jgi:hypothetical protein
VSLAQARDRAAELSRLLRSGVTDLHAHLHREQEGREHAAQAAQKQAQAEAHAATHTTLEKLFEVYVSHLKALQKPSARDAENVLHNHVLAAEPGLRLRAAKDVDVNAWVRLIGKVVEAGKGRTAGKLRSYARSAYALAIAAKADPTIPTAFQAFGIEVNPVASIPSRPFAKFNRTRKRHLSREELGFFLVRLEALPPGAVRDALEVDLYSGGQRPTQLLRARGVDVTPSSGILTLLDPKGARVHAREHPVILPGQALAIVHRRLAALKRFDAPLFSDDGETALDPATPSKWVTEISREMVTAREAREPFQLRDLRRTAETMMAELGVNSDVRAHIQSHGLGGVQKRHYDQHDYDRKRRRALSRWNRRLANLKAAAVRARSADNPAARDCCSGERQPVHAAV